MKVLSAFRNEREAVLDGRRSDQRIERVQPVGAREVFMRKYARRAMSPFGGIAR